MKPYSLYDDDEVNFFYAKVNFKNSYFNDDDLYMSTPKPFNDRPDLSQCLPCKPCPPCNKEHK